MGSDWLLPIYGLVVGMLVGLTGMGGGVLMTPLLVLGLGMPATAAIGTDLAYSSVTKLAGAWQHWRQGTVDMRVVRALAIGSVPATLVAVVVLFIMHGIDTTAVDGVLQTFIGVMLVVASALMLRKLWLGASDQAQALAASTGEYPIGRLMAIGALGGFMVGLTSIGSGSLIIALLVLILNDVNFALAGKLLIGSIPGVLIGSRLAVWVPRRPLQAGLAVLLLSTAFTLLR